MKTTILRFVITSVVLLAPLTLATRGAKSVSQEPNPQGHLSDLAAKITLPDGSSRLFRLEGVGCPTGMCSRIAIKGRAKDASLVKDWLDTLAAIKETNDKDALFVFKNGKEQRLSLMSYFRVLYLANQSGRTEKVDLAKIKSIEFLAPAK